MRVFSIVSIVAAMIAAPLTIQPAAADAKAFVGPRGAVVEGPHGNVGVVRRPVRRGPVYVAPPPSVDVAPRVVPGPAYVPPPVVVPPAYAVPPGYAPVYCPPAWTPEWYGCCAARYRSFNGHTGYYLTYAGVYRFCS